MSFVQRVSVAITTDASGDATAYSERVTGRLIDIQYVKTNFADTADFTITGETTGRTLWSESNVTASKIVAPRQPTHDTAAAASLYAAAGEPVEDAIYLANERVKVVVAQGGNATTGVFWVTVA